ncbi:MAG: alcohol dehydrogenase catalytic domain-containing protein [Ignisphaera sp.]|nr:alcohol dehydrogenase catalytic domain-containing protein [Ignisphaera sp.]MDW8084777.1 alcohol dehydrogenase catalytic domain-containing protein [Ignisphaera sp.]
MKALVIRNPYDAALSEVEEPRPGAGEVVVGVRACGVCGTDIHIYRGEEPRVTYPIIPGHEFSGVVVEVGRDVSGVAVGDRVAVDPNLACGGCYYCRVGARHFCERWEGIGVTRSGGFAEKVVVPVESVYRVPSAVPFERAALSEPISCVLHGIDALKPLRGGEKIAIFGAGPIGLIFLAILKRVSVADIAVFEIQPHRARKAMELGADVVADPRDDVVKTAREVTGGRGFNVIIDASGHINAISRILKLDIAAPQAKILLFGVAPPGKTVEVEPYTVYRKEISILGSYVNPYTMQRATEFLNKLEALNSIIDRINIGEALNIIRGESRGSYVKPIVVF